MSPLYLIDSNLCVCRGYDASDGVGIRTLVESDLGFGGYPQAD